jgi:type III secretion system FlhB-like substrate exporter
MNQEQRAHLQRILDQSHTLIANKYIKGAEEHKTTLSTDHSLQELVDFAIEEAIDQVTFLLTIKEVLEKSDGNSS